MVAKTVNTGVNIVEDKVEIKVFLDDEVKSEDKELILGTINKVDGVQEIKYETKKQALDAYREQLGEDNTLLSGFTDESNPFPNSYIVSVDKPEAVLSIEDEVKDLSGVEDIVNETEAVKTIVKISNLIEKIGLGIFVLLAIVSLFLVSNTIKLTVYSRRREIGIMKFVGATDWFIRLPFIIEGIFMGIIGAVLSIGVLYFSYRFVYLGISQNLNFVGFENPMYILNVLSWQFIIAGIVIGAGGSFIALRRFLDV
ncbi:MAG: ABC transporter permease [Clostridium sp.]|nr:ABC transporter permease [Clostridium sp.]